ncbi:hypothetical protein [Yersinia proxima]|uniref:hypothetical protein n=1 Tax=Yersinia proxima TaxID=2890316 RepID=UPI0037D2F54D
MTETITLCRIAIPDQDELARFWALFSAAGDVGRWDPQPTDYFLQRVDEQNISAEEKAFIGLAWDCLVLNHAGFGRLMAAFCTYQHNFQDSAKDYVYPSPSILQLTADAALMVIYAEAYEESKVRIDKQNR